MSELLGKKESLKKLIHTLHQHPEQAAQIKSQFRSLLEGLTPALISEVEQEVVAEGIPVEQIRQLCDVHLAVFRDAVEENQPGAVAPWHPIAILTSEHNSFLRTMEELRDLAKSAASLDEQKLARIRKLSDILRDGEKHYLREENVLFPQLEKRGIVQPPKIMWQEHDHIRELKRHVFAAVERLHTGANGTELVDAVTALQEMAAGHFYKENKILFPTAIEVIEDEVWPGMRQEFDEIGYVYGDPPAAKQAARPAEPAAAQAGLVDLGSGALTPEQLQAMLNTLPLDITFVDADDRVRYFSEGKDRIFVRTRSVLGRAVQNCHPQKSVHVVNQIVADFKSGRRDHADFWIRMGDKLILIRYFAVRNASGDYLGTVEVTLDATPIQQLQGEKRLYDEEVK